ncbi:MAG: diguanylate cyclase domain-containing protein [Pyrinomonadaceae bacterium]
MNLREAIEQLGQVVEDIKQAVVVDDKTPLKNALALRDESVLIDRGESEFDMIIFGDLNRFKTLNDAHGHDAGDVAIRVVGERISQTIIERWKAKAFRQSGDEFVILLRRDLIKRFLQETSAFAEILFTHREESLKTAMSFGYAVSDGKTNFNDLLKRAEVACQSAKNQGDGICIKWSKAIERNALISFRERCQKLRGNDKLRCSSTERSGEAKTLSML